MTKKQERNIIASVGTVLFMGLVILLLWLLKITVTKDREQEYVEMTMVEDLETEEPEIPKVRPEPAPSSQADPGAASPSQSQPNNQPTQTSAEQIVSEEEQLAIVQQHIADSIAEANRQAKKKAEDLIGGFTFTDQDDNGTAANQTTKGGPGTAPKGSGPSGKDWSLDGRGLVGNLPRPAGTYNENAKVVVRIRVNADGDVVEAHWTDQGTETANATIIKMAEEAAKKAKFTKGKHDQIGTITYTFKVN